MFAKAYDIAKDYVLPFIVSFRTYDGDCNTSLAAYVPINEDGWFVTTFHVVNQIQQFNSAIQKFTEAESRFKDILNDPRTTLHAKKSVMGKTRIPAKMVTNFSVWLGVDTYIISQLHVLPEIDLAVGKIGNFKKELHRVYPKFKDPDKPMNVGTSLCKVGYPFHQIKPTFNSSINRFELPNGSLPLPLFPMEGIFTRIGQVISTTSYPFSLRFLETSSPGLRGQSGGPTFDVNGVIWAIQSNTVSLPLGFGENAKNIGTKEADHLENQYLNLGLGVHSETICGFMVQHGIAFEKSDY